MPAGVGNLGYQSLVVQLLQGGADGAPRYVELFGELGLDQSGAGFQVPRHDHLAKDIGRLHIKAFL
ncbi:hypothetical protein D3C78_1831230 [compost metagenome]